MHFILGPATQIFDCSKFTDWETFKSIVSLKFSMTREQQENQFFEKKPDPQENIYDFINRVEQDRVRLGIEASVCYRSFQHFFPEEFKRSL